MLHDLLAIGQEDKNVSKKQQGCILVRHNDFDTGTILYAVTRFCKVIEEGAPEHFFNGTTVEDTLVGGGGVAAPVEENNAMEIPTKNMTDDSASSF